MKITLEMLKEKDACKEGLNWFVSHFGNEADSQDVVDKLNEEKTITDWEFWLAGVFKLSGEYKRWYFDGRQMEISNYKDGKLDGECKRWYSNGKQMVISNYKDGKLDGEYKRWYPDGRQWNMNNYKAGVLIKQEV